MVIIEGIPSGDLECWCLLVTLQTFEELTGKKPGQFDVGRFAKKGSPYRYMIYPDTLLFGEDAYKREKAEVYVISVDVIRKKDLL